MPIMHDFRCSEGHVTERMVSWDTEQVTCECGAVAERVFLPRSEDAARFQSVVVFRKPNGEFRFPGRSDERTPRGCQRIELKNIVEVRRFEREENQRLKNIHQESMSRRGANYEAEKKERREAFKSQLARMDPRVRRLAEFAMAQSDQKESYSSRASHFDANFRIDAFSNDRSNRSEFRDVDTGWRRRKE